MPIFTTNKDYGEPGMKISFNGDLFLWNPIEVEFPVLKPNESWVKKIGDDTTSKEDKSSSQKDSNNGGTLTTCNCGRDHAIQKSVYFDKMKSVQVEDSYQNTPPAAGYYRADGKMFKNVPDDENDAVQDNKKRGINKISDFTDENPKTKKIKLEE